MKREFTVNGTKYKVTDAFNSGIELDYKYDVYFYSTHYSTWTKCGAANTIAEAKNIAEARAEEDKYYSSDEYKEQQQQFDAKQAVADEKDSEEAREWYEQYVAEDMAKVKADAEESEREFLKEITK